MKKFAKAVVSALMITGLLVSSVACSSEDEGDTAPVAIGGQSQVAQANGGEEAGENSNAPQTNGSHTYSCTINGVTMGPNDLADPVIEALGSDYSYFESTSCAFQGLDKVYTYGSFIIRTYPLDGVDYINSIEFTDDTVQTAEGIYLGMSQEDIESTYDCSNANYTGNGIVLYGEDGTEALSFIVAGGSIIAISYSMVSE